MKPFLSQDFLLSTKTARKLYHEFGEKMPILDYHCHINPQEIYEDRKFDNMTQVWLGRDHYKWRQMRSNGVEEKYITGDAKDREKFQKWVETLEMAIGNPLYHWSHLELKRYFGYEHCLNRESAEEVWNFCNEKLRGGLTARTFIQMSNVRLLCTTDDPLDSLEWHKKLREDRSFQVQVLPTFRPDKAMSLKRLDYTDYIESLSQLSGVRISSFEDLIEALRKRMDFFANMGCCISDHGLDYVMYQPVSRDKMEAIFQRRLAGEDVTKEEEKQFQTAFMIAMGREYSNRKWVMQLHFGVSRNNHKRSYEKLGPDIGTDCINNFVPSTQIVNYLGVLAETDQLPKTILYSLNPADNAVIGTIIGCFQDSSTIGKIQQGSAWWFNDHKVGMIEQMTSLANLGLLGNFIGMLTDSRSFLSYTRHEYFRRILCDLIGGWVENGEYPEDYKALKKIIEGICYNNGQRYFEFLL